MFILTLCLGDGDFENYWLAVRNESPLAHRQFGDEGQFHTLHRSLNAPQGMTAQRDFVRRKDQPQTLLLSLTLEFGKSELLERQQQALFRRQFDFDCASVRVARPTFGCFCAHGFQWVDDDDEKA